jgi:hypothetical protein
MTALQRRSGSTIVELLCVLLLLAVVAGVSTLAIRRLPQPDVDDPYVQIARARRQAIETGRASSILVVIADSVRTVALGADGTIWADSAVQVDPLTGLRR